MGCVSAERPGGLSATAQGTCANHRDQKRIGDGRAWSPALSSLIPPPIACPASGLGVSPMNTASTISSTTTN
jgi:hypothetical protein